MKLALDIGFILLPIVLVGGIAVFVILRMTHKYKNGTLGKKKSKNAQSLLDSLIPIGMIVGFAVALLLSIIFSIPLVTTIAFAPGIGLLIGYFAYEVYSNMEEI